MEITACGGCKRKFVEFLKSEMHWEILAWRSCK
jgi:hypothetical protein